MSPHEIGILFVAAALVLLLSGMPVAFALGGVSVAFMLGFMPAANIGQLAETLYEGMDNFTLLAIPLFMLMGIAVGRTRAATDLYESIYRWTHRLPGGVGVANVIGCAIFAAMCGSSTATSAAIGAMGVPEMRQRGYSPAFAGALIASGGTLGILVPPSVTLILYGIVVEQSIGQLFLAGIVPGILLAFLFALWVVIKSYRQERSSRPRIAVPGGSSRGAEIGGSPGISTALVLDVHPAAAVAVDHFTWRERVESLPRLLPFFSIILVVMIALYGGYATPSEVAGVGAFATLVMVAIVYRCYHWREIQKILLDTAEYASMIMMIIAMAFLFSYVMSYLFITQSATQWLVTLPLSKWEFLFWIDVLIILMGFFLPPVAIVLMITPVIMPGLLAHGFDPIWFGVNMSLVMETGLIHPPVGLNLFVIQGIAPDIGHKDLMIAVLPFLAVILLFIVLFSVFPQIATWLPSLFFHH
ncbi:MAG TPA: TRAP transporter large permease [Acetobacteraceae bacterium]